MKDLLIIFMSSCSTHIYRPEIIGVVCDAETGLPITGVNIEFIQDSLTLGASFDAININVKESYQTDHNGHFKTILFKDKKTRDHLYKSDLSWMFTISLDGYITETIDLREMMPLNEPEHILDTIWLIKIPII